MKFWRSTVLCSLVFAYVASAAWADPAAPHTAVCAICGPREGAGAEPVAHTITHRGRVYHFCQTACRDEFLTNPDFFAAVADARIEGPTPTAGGFAPG